MLYSIFIETLTMVRITHYEVIILTDPHQVERAKKLLLRCLNGFEKMVDEEGIMMVLHGL
jgi:hypothetical protein